MEDVKTACIKDAYAAIFAGVTVSAREWTTFTCSFQTRIYRIIFIINMIHNNNYNLEEAAELYEVFVCY